MPSTTTHAFTLLELLVVIAIIGLLSSLVITQVRSARDKAHYAKALQFSAHLDRTLGAEAVGIWNFEEGTGTTATDVSGWGNHGTIHGATYTTETYNDEVSGYALSFDGVDDYVRIGYDPLYYGIGTGQLTVSLWANRQGTGGTVPRLVSTDCSNAWCIYLEDGGLGRLIFYTRFVNGSSHALVDSSGLPQGEWTHIVGTYNASLGEKELYINGQKIAEATVSTSGLGAEIGQEDEFAIGGNVEIVPQGNQVLNGFIDDVRLYATVLTAQEIKSHYLAGIEKLYAMGHANERLQYKE